MAQEFGAGKDDSDKSVLEVLRGVSARKITENISMFRDYKEIALLPWHGRQ